MTTHDPFDDLIMPIGDQQPRPGFARSLRLRIAAELGIDHEPLPTVQLPGRKRPMTTTAPASNATAVTPYLAVHDGAAALDWYAEALGAVEDMRVVGDDGRLGHAELHIGDAVIYLSDEYPEIGVVSPRTLGGTALALHLQVTDVDARYAQAIAAGATSLREPEDQPHGARHGTLLDPFGHRWMLSQQVEQVSVEEYAARSAGSGFEVVGAEIPGAAEGETITASDRPGTGGGIWAGVFYDDALAAIRFLVDTFGFEEQLVVVGHDDRTVAHSQLRWPEGGIVQVGTYDPDNQFSHAPGDQSLYVVTGDPQSVWGRCQAAGLEVIRPPESPDYDPEGMGFAIRDHEGNIWSFGTYGLGQSTR
jgi:PhnB protein